MNKIIKSILMSALLLLALPINAQYLGIKSGVGSFKDSWNYQSGLSYEHFLNHKFSIRSGLLAEFAKPSLADYYDVWTDDEWDDAKTWTCRVTIPLELEYKFLLTNNWRLYVDGGATLNFHVESELYDELIYENGQIYSEDPKRFVPGFITEAGIEYKNIRLGAIYYRDFVSTTTIKSDNKISNWMFSFGWRFGGNKNFRKHSNLKNYRNPYSDGTFNASHYQSSETDNMTATTETVVADSDSTFSTQQKWYQKVAGTVTQGYGALQTITKNESYIAITPELAMGMSGLYGKDTEDEKIVLSVDVGALAGYYMKNNLLNSFSGIETGLLYKRRGSRYKEDDWSEKLKLSYLAIPLRYSYCPSGNGLYVKTGFDLNFLVGARFYDEYDEYDDMKDDYDVKDECKKFDVSFIAELGYKHKSGFSVGTIADVGMIHIMEDVKAKNIMWGVKLGWNFRVK